LVFEVVHDGPKETDEFASDGDHGDERGFLGTDAVIDPVAW
jgi:hypothetical protein